MEPFVVHTGLVAPLDRANVDTDQIVYKDFLKRVERTGFGQFLFHHWRIGPDGTPDPGFPLNQPAYAGATVLVVGPNFGSGSSREHAVWALADYGFRAVVAPSFADIFYSNSLKNGLLPCPVDPQLCAVVMSRALAGNGYRVTVDLEAQTVSDDQGLHAPFAVDPFRKHCLLNGLDDIALTLQHAGTIEAFEARRPAYMPRATGT